MFKTLKVWQGGGGKKNKGDVQGNTEVWDSVEKETLEDA